MDEFEQIYSKYYSLVYGYVLRLCRDPHLAEEAAQEAFFKAMKSIDSFQGGCKLETWLCQIAKNTCLTMLEKRKRHTGQPEEDWICPEDMAQKFEDRETAFAIHRILHQLPEPYREVFWLRVFGELGFARIGELFEKSESWARVTYHRAKLKILERMDEA